MNRSNEIPNFDSLLHNVCVHYLQEGENEGVGPECARASGQAMEDIGRHKSVAENNCSE